MLGLRRCFEPCLIRRYVGIEYVSYKDILIIHCGDHYTSFVGTRYAQEQALQRRDVIEPQQDMMPLSGRCNSLGSSTLPSHDPLSERIQYTAHITSKLLFIHTAIPRSYGNTKIYTHILIPSLYRQSFTSSLMTLLWSVSRYHSRSAH